MSWPSNNARAEKKKVLGFGQKLTGSPTQIWKSRLSWRITLAVFLTILTIQVGILSVTIENHRQMQLTHLIDEGRSAIVPLIHKGMASMGASPFDDDKITELTNLTLVQGLAVYASVDGQLIRNYGQPTAISLSTDRITGMMQMPDNYYSMDGSYYDVIYSPG